MTALVAVTALMVCGLVAKKATAANPIHMTERGSAVLVWLENHKRPGTPRSRAQVRRKNLWRVVTGLKRAGVYFPFLCVHSHEAAWNAHNYPYGGGLQEDTGFQSTYGSEYIALWGSAGYWPPWAQMVAAYRAHHGYHGFGARGFTPWPNTARMCGLL